MRTFFLSLKIAWDNLMLNKARSVLTIGPRTKATRVCSAARPVPDAGLL